MIPAFTVDGVGDDRLTVDATGDCDLAVGIWARISGDPQLAIWLQPYALRNLADDLRARANLLDPKPTENGA